MAERKAVGYVRVSTDEQATSGVSLGAQEEAVRAYCAMRGLELAEVVVDAGVSGGKPLSSRPGGRRLAAALAASRSSAVVAYKMDRLFRDAADCLTVTQDWLRRGVALHLVDLGGQSIDSASPMGRFFLTIMAGCAEWERNVIRERTRAALAHLRARGRRVGGVPYGLRAGPDGVLVPEPAEARAASLARAWRAQGMSLRSIRDRLEAEGHPPRGRSWHLTTVSRMCGKRAAADQ